MADVIHAQIIGLGDLRKKLAKLADLGDTLTSALLAGGYVIEGGAKIRVPVDTGNLRASISTRPEYADQQAARVSVGTGVEYAAAVEFGFHGTESVREHQRRGRSGAMHSVRSHMRSVNRAAQPYLRPAFDESRGTVLEAVSAVLRRAVQERAR